MNICINEYVQTCGTRTFLKSAFLKQFRNVQIQMKGNLGILVQNIKKPQIVKFVLYRNSTNQGLRMEIIAKDG